MITKRGHSQFADGQSGRMQSGALHARTSQVPPPIVTINVCLFLAMRLALVLLFIYVYSTIVIPRMNKLTFYRNTETSYSLFLLTYIDSIDFITYAVGSCVILSINVVCSFVYWRIANVHLFWRRRFSADTVCVLTPQRRRQFVAVFRWRTVSIVEAMLDL